eukprot:180007_1
MLTMKLHLSEFLSLILIVTTLILAPVYSVGEGWWFISNEWSNKSLDCDPTPVEQTSSSMQIFELIYIRTNLGYKQYQVKCFINNYCWDYRGGDAKIGRESCSTTNPDQWFKFRTKSENRYEITGAYERYLEMSGTDDNAQLITDATPDNAPQQYFTVIQTTVNHSLLPTPIPTPFIDPATSKYIMVDGQKPWSEAETYCINIYGTHLASINSEQENIEAYSICAHNKPSSSQTEFLGCWIGFIDYDMTHEYVWTDSSPVNYTKWREGAPNSAASQCTLMYVNYKDSQWEDTACSSNDIISRFLCMTSLTIDPTTSVPTMQTLNPTTSIPTMQTLNPTTSIPTMQTLNPTLYPTKYLCDFRLWDALNPGNLLYTTDYSYLTAEDLANIDIKIQLYQQYNTQRGLYPLASFTSQSCCLGLQNSNEIAYGSSSQFMLLSSLDETETAKGSPCTSYYYVNKLYQIRIGPHPVSLMSSLDISVNMFDTGDICSKASEPNFVMNCNLTYSPTATPTNIPTYAPTVEPTKDPTNNPTTIPTYYPSLEPTYYPTSDPTIEPTYHPILKPTITPTIEPTTDPTLVTVQATLHPVVNPILVIIGGIIVVIICVLICIIVKMSGSKPTPKPMRNPMCLLLAIGNYQKNLVDKEFEGYVDDLDVDIDIKNLLSLFRDELCYHVVPKYKKDRKLDWTLNEIKTLLTEQAAELARNLSSNDANKYDGLIVVVSGHGLERHLITSDYKLIEKNTIHRQFTQYYPVSRMIPRVVIYDCCAGDEDRKGLPKNKNIGKGYEVKNIAPPNLEEKDSSRSVPVWSGNDENPDYNLATIYSSNIGFQSKMNRYKGSYLINLFVDKIRTKNSDQLFLGDICDEIQNGPELKHKQLPVCTFNNNTRFITFIRNNDGNVNSIEQSNDEKEELEVGVDGKNPYNALPSDEMKFEEKDNDRTDNMTIEMSQIDNNGDTSIPMKRKDNQEIHVSLNNSLEFIQFRTSTAL